MASNQTSNKPQRNGGPGKLRGAKDGVPFTKDNQPSGQAKSKGKRKAKILKELLAISTGKNFNSVQQQQYRKLTAEYFNIPESEVDVETIMHFRQIEKAIAKGDTYAYTSVMDRAFGKPKQPLSNDEENPITFEPKIIIQTVTSAIPIKENQDEE